jgi:hypothetical protein
MLLTGGTAVDCNTSLRFAGAVLLLPPHQAAEQDPWRGPQAGLKEQLASAPGHDQVLGGGECGWPFPAGHPKERPPALCVLSAPSEVIALGFVKVPARGPARTYSYPTPSVGPWAGSGCSCSACKAAALSWQCPGCYLFARGREQGHGCYQPPIAQLSTFYAVTGAEREQGSIFWSGGEVTGAQACQAQRGAGGAWA